MTTSGEPLMGDPASEFGTLEDPNTICFTRTVRQPGHRIWHAITNEVELPKWFVPYPVHLDLRVGGAWRMDEPNDPQIRTFWGTIVDVKDQARVELAWGVGPSSMWFELEPNSRSTLVRFGHRLNPNDVAPAENAAIGYGWGEQPQGPGTFQPGLAAAWHEHLDRMASYLSGEPVPALGTVVPGVVDHYRRQINLVGPSTC
jgi:uncharacterized protein YndB with AHSA1/START domain